MTWIKKWEVSGSNGKIWIVSLADDGHWGCSCPVWKFRRVECHHIQEVQSKYYPNGEEEKDWSELELQLLSVIKKCMDKITSKSRDIKIPINEDFTIGINNVGIGRVGTSLLDGGKQVYKINDLETYLMILKNEKAIKKIKRYIHKDEKKSMLDTLHKHLKDWDGLKKKEQEKVFANLFNEVTPYLMIDTL